MTPEFEEAWDGMLIGLTGIAMMLERLADAFQPAVEILTNVVAGLQRYETEAFAALEDDFWSNR